MEFWELQWLGGGAREESGIEDVGRVLDVEGFGKSIDVAVTGNFDFEFDDFRSEAIGSDGDNGPVLEILDLGTVTWLLDDDPVESGDGSFDHFSLGGECFFFRGIDEFEIGEKVFAAPNGEFEIVV